MGQLIRYSFNPPPLTEGQDVDEYMCTSFINALRSTFEQGGYLEKSNNSESGGTFLVGFRGRLFKIQNDFQVSECILPFDACGCGEELAQGAMSALQTIDTLEPSQKVEIALKAAEQFSAGVRAPFTILTLQPKK